MRNSAFRGGEGFEKNALKGSLGFANRHSLRNLRRERFRVFITASSQGWDSPARALGLRPAREILLIAKLDAAWRRVNCHRMQTFARLARVFQARVSVLS